MARGKIVFTEEQISFLLSPAAKALKPLEAKSLTADESYERFKEIRWGWQQGRPYCPHCGHERVYEYAERGKFKCARCGRQFSVTTRTTFQSRKLPFKTILAALAIRLHDPMNAHQLSKELDINYRTSANLISTFKPFSGNIVPKTSENRWPFLNNDGAAATELLLRVNETIPKALPEQVRADVGQDIILGILSGEISEENLRKDVAWYIRQHYAGMEWRFDTVSLDAPMHVGDWGSWHDVIPSDVDHF